MRKAKLTSMITIFFFLFFTVSGSYSGIFPDTLKDENDISDLLTKAENSYQNGNFKEAIGIYEQIIVKLKKRKELVKMKQKLFKTMIQLALTYFTIQETEKSKLQLEKLIVINPNQEIDEEIYPPRFTQIFKEVQTNYLGELTITSVPAGASITIDNTSYGNTPVNIKKFTKGEYILTAVKKGYIISTKKILVKEGTDNKIEITLEKSGKKKVVEKAGVKRKKKKISPLLLIGGAVLLLGILSSASKKKDTEVQENIISRQFLNDVSVPITRFVPAYSVIEVAGIKGAIRRVEFAITVNHPKIEELTVALIGTDNRTIYSVWNKGPHEHNGKVFTGTTEIFNSIEPNGNWVVVVNNSGDRKEGEIAKWVLKVYYVQY